MPITLAEAKQSTQDKLTQYVIDEFRKSALLDMLEFDNTVLPSGDGKTMTYSYNRVTTFPTAAGRAINTEYVAQEAKTTQFNVNLKPFGGSFELDRVIIQYEKKVFDHIKFQTQQKIKATLALFHDWFINGDSGVDPNQFDGLEKAIAGSTTELTPGAAINLSSSANIDTNWKVFTDAMRKLQALLNGMPTVWLMNNDMFAVFQSVMDRAGINLTSKYDYGFETVQWGPSLAMALGNKPGSNNPIIPIDANGETSIYPVRLGLDAVHGVSPDGDKLADVYLPNLKVSGAVKKGEVEMVAAVAIKHSRSAGALRKIKIA
jgi:hypothetical protein